MRPPSLSQRRALAVIVVLLIVSAVLPSGAGAWLSGPARQWIEALTMPLAHPLHALGVRLRGRPTVEVADAEQQEMRETLARSSNYLRQLEAELRLAREKLAQFEMLTRLDQQGRVNLQRVSFLSADVTGWSGRNPGRLLTINRGRSSGVRDDLVVTDGINLVGRVVDVGGMTASVRLITSEDRRIEVRLIPPLSAEPTRDVPGHLQPNLKKGFFTMPVEIHSPVQVGDLAHLSGGAWPGEALGFVVGQVTGFADDPDPLNFRTVVVEPAVDLVHLQRVVVLVPAESEQ